MINKIWKTLDKRDNYRSVFLWFLFIWLVINLIQSYFTELAHDEAYYWMYSRNLAWGYFDHPPVIALLVKFGYSIFPNELGVRLFPTIMGTTTLFVVYKILEEQLKSISFLMFLMLSVLILQTHLGGFLAIPDLPMIFCAALFFLMYKKYLREYKWQYAVALGVISAIMLYSKYIGVLVLFFTLLSNFKILKKPSFYLIPGIIVIAMIPHLLWQINNDFPTFSYHLVGRSSAYSIDRTLGFIAGQLVIAGPFAGLMLLYHAFKVKIKEDEFLRAMKFNLYGFFAFFLLSSFKGHVEPHWTVIGFIPLLVLSYKSMLTSEMAQKWLRILVVPSIIFVLSLRLFFLFDLGILPKSIPVVNEFHNWDVFAKQVKELAGGRKVVFVNSFQFPSKYTFYSGGDFSHGLNSIHYRQNQYDLWGFEKQLQNEDILLVGGGGKDVLKSPVGDFSYRKIDNFKSYYDVKISLDSYQYTLEPEEKVELKGYIKNNRDSILIFQSADTIRPPRISINWHNGRKWVYSKSYQTIQESIVPGDSISLDVNLTGLQEPGSYSCYLSIVNDHLWAPFNSNKITIVIE